jgi:hypothetical protein
MNWDTLIFITVIVFMFSLAAIAIRSVVRIAFTEYKKEKRANRMVTIRKKKNIRKL